MGLIDVTKTEQLEHPSEEGVTIQIRSLRGTEMDEASDLRVKKTVEMWGATLEVLQGLMKPQEQPDTIEVRMKNYDASTLLKYAIVSWSYSETVDAKQIDDLDAITRGWLLEEVVRRNTRPLPLSKSGGANSNSEGALKN